MVNYLILVFLLCIGNSFVNAMEVECKSLASFFDVNVFFQHADICANIARYYGSKNQLWYVDKRLEHEGDVLSAYFNKDGTNILTAESIIHNSGFYLWDSNTGQKISVGDKITTWSIQRAVFDEAEKNIIVPMGEGVDIRLLIYPKTNTVCNNPKTLRWQMFYKGKEKDSKEMILVSGYNHLWYMDMEQDQCSVVNYCRFRNIANWNHKKTEFVEIWENTLKIFDKNGINHELSYTYDNFIPRSVSYNHKKTELLVCGGFDEAKYACIIYIQDRSSGKILMQLVNSCHIFYAYFNKQDKEICTFTLDGMIRIWNRSTGKVVAQFYNGSANLTRSLDWNYAGNKIVTATDKCAVIWTRYDNCTLAQLLLRNLLGLWILVEKPNKTIDSSIKLLGSVAAVLRCDKDELCKVWNSFSENIQETIWLSMNRLIQQYGK